MILIFILGLVALRILYSVGEVYYERDWPRDTWKGLLIALGVLCIAVSAFGQAARVDLPLLTAGPSVPISGGPLPQALWVANAAAYLCTHPSATLVACQAAPITTYTDSTEGTTCPTATPLVQLPGNTCTASTGTAANVGFWYGGGVFDYWIVSSYGTYGPFSGNSSNSALPSSCGNPTGIPCGGTGATTAAQALANLGGQVNLSATQTGSGSTGTAAFPGTIAAGTTVSGNINGCTWVDGTHYAQTNAGIQSAINAAAVGGCVYLPPAVYALTSTVGQQILLTKSLRLVCGGWGANLQDQSSASIPLIRYAPSGSSGYVDYGASIEGCQLSVATAGNGSYAIEVDTTTNGSVKNLVLDHNYIGCSNTGLFQCAGQAFGTGAIYFNNDPAGTGGTLSDYIYNNTIYGSITLALAGDAINFDHNDIWNSTNTDVFYADFVAGSTSFRFQNNTIRIPLHLGAVTSGSVSASFPIIQNNEWEPNTVSLAGSNGALLDLDGASASAVYGAKIEGNSFQMQAVATTLNTVRLNYATQTDIGGKNSPNNFQIGTSPAHGVISTANAYGNRLNHNLYSSSVWATILDDVAVNTQITEDAYESAATPLLTQNSSGGTTLYGPSGAVLEGYANVTYITDGDSGSSVAGAFSAAHSNVPVNGTVFSDWETYTHVLSIGASGVGMTANQGNALYAQHSSGWTPSAGALICDDGSGNTTISGCTMGGSQASVASSNVTMTTAGTYYDGPTTGSQAAGTWLIQGTVSLQTSATPTAAINFTCKLWDGTTVFSSTGDYIELTAAGATKDISLSLSAVATEAGAATFKISCTSDTASQLILYQTAYGSVANASSISAVRIK